MTDKPGQPGDGRPARPRTLSVDTLQRITHSGVAERRRPEEAAPAKSGPAQEVVVPAAPSPALAPEKAPGGRSRLLVAAGAGVLLLFAWWLAAR